MYKVVVQWLEAPGHEIFLLMDTVMTFVDEIFLYSKLQSLCKP